MQRVNHTVGIDGPDPFGHGFDFRPAQVSVEGRQLPVDVADANVVHIKERQLADSRASECFNGPGANAADADDTNVRGA